MLSMSFAFWLNYHREQQIEQLVDESIPTLEQAYERQKLFIENNQLLSQIIESKNSANLVAQHQAYLANLQQFKSLSISNKRQLDKAIKLEESHFESLQRLTNNNERNIQLQRNSLIQLQLLIDEFDREISDKTEKQRSLFQQINQDNVKDRVTVVRARAYAKLTQSLDLSRQTQRSIADLFVLFSSLTLQTSLTEFNYMSDQLEQLLALWQPQLAEISQANALEKPLLNLLNELNNLLFLQQNTLAKWRGHLRVSQDYFAFLILQKNLLKAHLLENTGPTVNLVNLIPDKIQRLAKPYFTLTTQHYRIVLLIAFILLIGFVWLLVTKLQKKVQGYGEQSVKLFKALLVDKSANTTDYLSRENQQIANFITDAIKPEHDEYDYQHISNELLNMQQLLFQQANSAVWQLSNNNNGLNNHFAVSLLQNKALHEELVVIDDVELKFNWKKVFNQQAIKTLIVCARAAQHDQQAHQCKITLATGTFLITLAKDEQNWLGTITRADEQQLLENNIQQLEQDLTKLVNENQSGIVESAETLSKMLIRTMLQSQSVSIGSGETSSQVYRQLTRIFDWCRQIQINTALMNEGKTKVLSDVNLRNELHGLIHNMMTEANQQRNHVYLHIDEQLLIKGRLNSRLFHRTLKSLVRTVLVEQFNAELLFKVDVVDKNSGQQVVRFSLNVSTDKKLKNLPDVINLLLNVEEDNVNKAPQIIRYLHTLLTHTHSTNIQASMIDQGFQLSIDMPIAIAESDSKSKAIDVIDFKQAAMLLISNNKQCIDLITQQVANANGEIENLTKLEHFIRQVNAKHLTRKALSVVIVTSDVFNTSYEKIQQHIHSLPKGLQPKLMVLQSTFDQKFHKYGFFADTDGPVENSCFKQQLKTFIDGKQADNLLIEPEIFNRHRFVQNQVEVLIAIEHPQQQQQLLRLLHWLGLQVQVVSQEQSLLKHWQSGRYLLLITEFDYSPYIELEVGKNIQRAIFTLGKKTFKKNNAVTKLTKHWSQACMPNFLDIDALVKVFSPWLKTKQFALIKEKTASEIKKLPIASRNKVSDEASINLSTSAVNIENEAVFDLLAYAQNQGSPELAVIMLDDYLIEITLGIDAIAIAIDKQQTSEALKEIQNIIIIAQTMAATDLLLICQELKALLTAKQFEQAKLKHQQLSLEQERMTLFAQAI